MRLWTYKLPFHYQNDQYEVKFFFSMTEYTSQLFRDGILIDEFSGIFKTGMKVVEHNVELENQTSKLTVSVGYISMWTVAIEVREDDDLIYASHPGKDIRYAEKTIQKLNALGDDIESPEEQQRQQEKWQKNKHSIFADVFLGIAFFIVAKVTDDLTLAAFTGVGLGLGLVVLQRFVKVDLLGGFAVFGTAMLLISAIFSLVYQSEYMVQMKGTILGILTASLALADGVFRKGGYFGARFERYLNSPIDHAYFVTGLGLIGLVMAALNYLVATYFSKDFWLTYSTFLDMPLYMVMIFTLVWQAGKKHSAKNRLNANKG